MSPSDLWAGILIGTVVGLIGVVVGVVGRVWREAREARGALRENPSLGGGEGSDVTRGGGQAS